jgi:hypothetical protein
MPARGKLIGSALQPTPDQDRLRPVLVTPVTAARLTAMLAMDENAGLSADEFVGRARDLASAEIAEHRKPKPDTVRGSFRGMRLDP